MLGNFLVIGRQQGQLEGAQVNQRRAIPFLGAAAHLHHQRILPSGQIDVDIGQQFRIQQGAVQRTARIVDFQPVAQGVERIAFARLKS